MEGRYFDRLLDSGISALVQLEVNELRRFVFFPGQLLLHLPPKLFLRCSTGFVQPGCTIELLARPIPQVCNRGPRR
jgi:hypothetical protein